MKKTDDTFLKWLEKVSFNHCHTESGHKVTAVRNNKDLYFAVHKNPFIAMMSVGSDLRALYFLSASIGKEDNDECPVEGLAEITEDKEEKNEPKNKKSRK